VLLREVDGRIGLIDAINAAIPDPRNQGIVIHDQRTLLAQRILRIALEDTEFQNAQVGTIRVKSLKIGAPVKTCVRRIVLYLI